MIDHLIDVHGRRHIVFLRGPANQEDSHWREMGYKASLEAHAIKYDPALVLWGEFDREKAYQVFQSFLLNNHPEFDAVFSGDDDAAVGVISAIQDSGMTVPGSVSVVGFDDQYFSSFMSPSLTTIHAPTEEVGRSAGQQIFKILQDQTADPITLLSTEVVIRQSCGCVA
jgi:DNA-binding LacI/PurR family transcriptional regulator